MNIRTTKPVVVRDDTSGELTSFASGQVYTVTTTLGNQLIADGLATEVTELTPDRKSVV